MRKYRYFTLLLLFEVTFSLHALCQENYQPGFIITQNGDTLKGMIDNRNKWGNPDSIKFKCDSKPAVEIFTPQSISGFAVKGDKYVSAEIRKDQLHSGQSFNSESTPVFGRVFLLVIIEGEKNLYSYFDADRKFYYFIRAANGYEWLEFRQYEAVKNADPSNSAEEKYMKKESKYIGQLILYFQDCPKIRERINSTVYDSKSLTQLYTSYYKNCGTEIVYLKTRQKVKMSLGVLGGASFTKLDFSGVDLLSSLGFVVNADYSMDVKPAAGIFFELTLPRNNGKWSLLTELLYTSFETSATTTSYQTPEYYRVYTSTFDYSHIGLHEIIRFAYPVGQARIFINGGLRVNFQASGENTLVEVDHLYENIITNPPVEALSTLNVEYGLLAGMGLRYKRWSIEGRYNFSTGFTNYAGFSSKINQVNVLAGFRIF